MKLFWYRAMTSEGTLVRGSGEHASEMDLIDSLVAEGLQPYSVWSLPSWLTVLWSRPLNMGAVAEFCQLIGQHVRAGADLRLALTEAVKGASTTRLRMLCARLKRSLERGDTLAQAMEATRAFPMMLRHLLTVGEETGQLENILGNAASQYEQARVLRAAILRATIYPAIVLVVLLLSCAFWMLFVIPKMTAMFDSLRVTLPPATLKVIAATEWLRAYGAWLPLVLLPLALAVPLLWRHPFFAPAIHAVVWWMPGVKGLERSRVYYAFFSNLGTMQSAGMTLTRSLAVLLQQPVNQHFGSRLTRMSASTRRGLALSDGLAQSGVFERFALSMIRLGETTGTLDKQSLLLSEHYSVRLKQQIETGSRLFEPLVLLVLGVFLLLIGATMLGPVYELASRAATGLKP
ncbi:MAG: type II secretion system F family protein [Pseudomonadota bacterium]